MKFERELGEKGQVVIPKDIRKLLGLRSGQKVIFETREDEVVLKTEDDPTAFLKEFFSIPRLKKNLTQKEIEQLLEEQYDLP